MNLLKTNLLKLFQNPLANSVIFCVLCFGLLYVFPGWHIETSDDIWMDNILAGIQTCLPEYIVFSNVILGKMLSFLYQICPNISWYVSSQIILIFLAAAFVFHSHLRIFGLRNGTIVNVMLGIIIGLECLCQINFTRTSALLMISSLYLSHIALNERKSHYEKIIFIASLVFLVMGSLLRFQVVYVVGVFYCGMLICFVSQICFTRQWGKLANNVKRMWLFWAVAFVLVIGAKYADVYYRQNNKDVQAFEQINLLRSQIFDYPIYDYDIVAQKLTQSGFSHVDYEMLTHSFYSIYDYEQLRTFHDIVHIPSWRQFLGKYSKAKFVSTISSLLTRNHLSFVHFIMAFVLLGMLKGYRKIYPVVSILGCCLFITLFMVLGRVVDRVLFAVYLSALFSLLHFCRTWEVERIKNINASTIQYVSFFCIFLVSVFSLVPVFSIKKTGIKENKMRNFVQTVQKTKNKDNLYMIDHGETKRWEPQNIFTRDPSFDKSNFNFYRLTGISGLYNAYFPDDNLKILSPLEIMKIINSQSMFYVDCGDLTLMNQFLNQASSHKVEPVYVKTIEGYKVYRFVSANL